MEKLQTTIDFQTVSVGSLDDNLRQFYAEAQPKNLSKRALKMPENQAQEYHKNTLKSVRAAINRHLKDIGRTVDIVRDTEFKSANAMLSAKLKFNLRNGLSRPTQHHPIISNQELMQINTYLSKKEDIVALRFRVWYLLAIHFVSRGIEFHHQLSMSSIKFQHDEEGIEFLTINHETHQKNYQGGLEDATEEAQDKRMYATSNSASCPVQAVKLYLSKCDPESKSLLNQCSRDALHGNPNMYAIWYTTTPVKVKHFSTFMPDICKNAGVKRYTGHSLRATAITAMSDAGLTDRNIMYMSDHKCEESLKSYCRRPSTGQKQKISTVLENVATGTSSATSTALVPRENLPVTTYAVGLPNNTSSAGSGAKGNVNLPGTGQSVVSGRNPLLPVRAPNQNVLVNSQTSHEISKISGFGEHSLFQNCSFHFN